MKIGLIGDYQESVAAHEAIPIALELAAKELSLNIESHWIHTDSASIETLENYAAIWCVPASPYANTENVLNSIHYARSRDIPFLGTCGGYQHAALEFAKNSLGYAEADNAEINPATSMPLISGLACKLYDTKADVYLEANSRVSKIYNRTAISEDYFCGFGVNREYLPLFDNSDMWFSGFDADGDPRTLEIKSRRFFIGTAFQPERSAFEKVSHPLIRAFLLAAQTTL